MVRKYGWDNIEYGLLLKLSGKITDIVMNKKILLEREQYYLDTYSPSVNTNKVARSILGYRDTEENKWKFSSIPSFFFIKKKRMVNHTRRD